MNGFDLVKAQVMIDRLPVNSRACLSEIYGDEWSQIKSPTSFGKIFKKAVENKELNRIQHVGIRSTGRCDEYRKL